MILNNLERNNKATVSKTLKSLWPKGVSLNLYILNTSKQFNASLNLSADKPPFTAAFKKN
jgi:hypothetical protein